MAIRNTYNNSDHEGVNTDITVSMLVTAPSYSAQLEVQQ